LLDTLFAVAQDAGRTPAQVAINWLLQRPLVTAPIIGVRSMEQLEANLAAAGWALTPEQIERLDQASSPGYPYPYENVANLQVRR